MGAPKRKQCIRGHRMAGKNLLQRKDGARECRACKAVRAKERHQQIKQGLEDKR